MITDFGLILTERVTYLMLSISIFSHQIIEQSFVHICDIGCNLVQHETFMLEIYIVKYFSGNMNQASR